jgi:hypothetical protein
VAVILPAVANVFVTGLNAKNLALFLEINKILPSGKGQAPMMLYEGAAIRLLVDTEEY